MVKTFQSLDVSIAMNYWVFKKYEILNTNIVGTYRMKSIDELRPVVTEAIRSGYRLIGKLSQWVFYL